MTNRTLSKRMKKQRKFSFFSTRSLGFFGLLSAVLFAACDASSEEVVTANYSVGTQQVTVGGLILAGGCSFANDLAVQTINLGNYSKTYFDQHSSTPEFTITLRLTCTSEEALKRLQLRFEADSGISAASNTALDSGIDGLMIPIKFEGAPVDFVSKGGLVSYPDSAYVSDESRMEFKVSAALAKTSIDANVGTGTINRSMTIRLEYQ